MSKRRGEKPGDLPVIAPTKYQPPINLNATRLFLAGDSYV